MHGCAAKLESNVILADRGPGGGKRSVWICFTATASKRRRPTDFPKMDRFHRRRIGERIRLRARAVNFFNTARNLGQDRAVRPK